jgi:hypothetical protein
MFGKKHFGSVIRFTHSLSTLADFAAIHIKTSMLSNRRKKNRPFFRGAVKGCTREDIQ